MVIFSAKNDKKTKNRRFFKTEIHWVIISEKVEQIYHHDDINKNKTAIFEIWDILVKFMKIRPRTE